MATKIVIPNVGESVTSGVIAAWSVKDGEWVDRDQTVLELETDKVTMEVPAPASGIVRHGASEGDEVEVGSAVGEIDETATKPSSSEAAESKPQAKAEASAETKSATAVATPVSTQDKAPEAPKSAANGSVSHGPSGDIKATPLARKLAEDKGVDLGSISGTGAGGRIREQDVLAFIQTHQNGAPATLAPAQPASQANARGVRREKMTPLRQRIASRLVEAQQTAAMLTTFNEVDMGAVMDLRKQYKDQFAEKHGIGLGFMSFFVKAAVQALQKFPLINAYITAGDDGKPAIEHHDYQDVAIAVAGPKGLVVPVIRNAETLSFADIEKTIKDFGVRARDGKLDLSEMTGGTFTITNGGVFGSLMSTPILNPPQSAILGMHGIKKRAVEYPEGSGQIALRPMMYLALSYDHRIVDGAEAVQFLVSIKNAIEDPARLMLDL
ncbi:MAG: 2-oxoglutarate dehydrogenase complex dihydrolipoyllysine-residue succinyltransferase [Planctomycetota bacterium]|nr:MAG: 2-oxoglutarate dehydrogenase complex dihydrolipoyllysine-residue succinyltransferase [Planctomycetota bacterium]